MVEEPGGEATDVGLTGHTRTELEGRHLAELHELASANRVPRFRALGRPELIDAILATASDQAGAAGEPDHASIVAEPEEPLGVRVGVLDLVPDGYGFLRVEGLARSDDDVYVSRSLVQSLGLRSGDELAGPVGRSRGPDRSGRSDRSSRSDHPGRSGRSGRSDRSGRSNRPGRADRYLSLLEVETVNGGPAEQLQQGGRPLFDDLTPIPPSERVSIVSRPDALATRMADLIAPLGKGQRCLIASPPGAGATTLLREIAQDVISAGAVRPMIVLVDVRPEEITDWRRAVDAPVFGGSSDRSPESQVRLAELALERGRRLAEQGEDVVLLLDSLTRLARARALVKDRSRRAKQDDDDDTPGESRAVGLAKRWFAAARNTEEHGSLTIVAIARAGSDSAFEQLLYEVLADSANMELRLDRELSQAGLFPPLDVNRCWSHHADAIVGADEAAWSAALRRSLTSLAPADAWRAMADRIVSTPSNSDLIRAG